RVLRHSWPSPQPRAGKYLYISFPISNPSIFKGFIDFYTGKFMVEYLKRGVEACKLLLQACELGLPRRGRTVRTSQRGRDTLDLLPVLPDDHVFRLHLGHASVDTGGQALELGVRAAATVGIQVPLERSTDVSQGLRHA